MARSTTESIENFWSHFPDGLTYRELLNISEVDTIYYSQNRAVQSIVESEVSIQLVAEPPIEN